MNHHSYVMKHFDKLKDIMIGDTQYSLLITIEERGSITTADLQKMTGKSMKACSKRLTDMYERGYLKRTADVDPTGGIYYHYLPAWNNSRSDAAKGEG